MKTFDTIALGTCILCIITGVIKHRPNETSSTSPMNNQTSPLNSTDPDHQPLNETNSTNITFVHPEEEIAEIKILSISQSERKKMAIAQYMALDEPQIDPPPPDFDYYTAREALKKYLFSAREDGETNQLSEAKRWEIINSELLPW